MSRSLPAALERCRELFEGVPPFGPLLRERFADRWLRVHSLPGARRYAESPSDVDDLLARQNLVLTTLLDHGAECLTLVPVLAGDDVTRADQDAARAHLARVDGLDGALLRGWSAPELDVPAPFEVEAALIAFHPGVLDARLLALADEQLFGLVVVGLEQCCAIAPYPGGLDVIASTPAARDALARRWAAWVPTIPPPPGR